MYNGIPHTRNHSGQQGTTMLCLLLQPAFPHADEGMRCEHSTAGTGEPLLAVGGLCPQSHGVHARLHVCWQRGARL